MLWPKASGNHSNGSACKTESLPPGPTPAGRSSAGSTGTTRPGFLQGSKNCRALLHRGPLRPAVQHISRGVVHVVGVARVQSVIEADTRRSLLAVSAVSSRTPRANQQLSRSPSGAGRYPLPRGQASPSGGCAAVGGASRPHAHVHDRCCTRQSRLRCALTSRNTACGTSTTAATPGEQASHQSRRGPPDRVGTPVQSSVINLSLATSMGPLEGMFGHEDGAMVLPVMGPLVMSGGRAA
jgi:hypothetical protein